MREFITLWNNRYLASYGGRRKFEAHVYTIAFTSFTLILSLIVLMVTCLSVLQ